MAALTRLVPASQITYGTDYPYFGLDQFKDLEELGLSAAELESIGGGNATPRGSLTDRQSGGVPIAADRDPTPNEISSSIFGQKDQMPRHRKGRRSPR